MLLKAVESRLVPLKWLTRFITVDRSMSHWIASVSDRFAVDLVLIGPRRVLELLELASEAADVWIRDYEHFNNWHVYAADARQNRHLVEVVIGAGTDPGDQMQGIEVSRFTGYGHQIGRL